MRNTIILNYSLDSAIWKFKFSGFFLNVIFQPYPIFNQCADYALTINDFRKRIRIYFCKMLMVFAIISLRDSVSASVRWSRKKSIFFGNFQSAKKTPQSKVEFGISGHAESGKLAILAQSEIKCSSERYYNTCPPNRSNVSYNRHVKKTKKTLLQNVSSHKILYL